LTPERSAAGALHAPVGWLPDAPASSTPLSRPVARIYPTRPAEPNGRTFMPPTGTRAEGRPAGYLPGQQSWVTMASTDGRREIRPGRRGSCDTSSHSAMSGSLEELLFRLPPLCRAAHQPSRSRDWSCGGSPAPAAGVQAYDGDTATPCSWAPTRGRGPRVLSAALADPDRSALPRSVPAANVRWWGQGGSATTAGATTATVES